MEAFMAWLKSVNDVVWGPGMLVLLVGTGLYLTVGLKFFTFRNFFRGLKNLWAGRSNQSEQGEISPFNALMTALAADIGTGNIVGVSTAIYIGGPGALFWMWVTALVGMATKFSEVLLSVHFREKTPAGNWVGGAMYFIKNGLGPKWVWLGTCFAVFGICACIGTGGMVQAKAITDNISGTFGLPAWLCGLVLVALCVAVLLGGVRRIGAVAGKIVPFMAIMYVFMCLLIIGMNIEKVPSVFWWVISDAFQPTAATGGFVGATVMMAIRLGVARGLFSNESGLGSAPIAAAAAREGKSLDEVAEIAQRYADSMASVTVKSTDATHPQNGMSFGDLGETDLMEIGAGQHGEGGGVRVPMMSSKDTVATVAEALCKALDLKPGDKTFVMINGCGATTMMEMLVLFKDTVEFLKAKGIEVVASMVGEILTVQEAAGFQMNIAKWDEEMLRLWNTPCRTPAFSKE